MIKMCVVGSTPQMNFRRFGDPKIPHITLAFVMWKVPF